MQANEFSRRHEAGSAERAVPAIVLIAVGAIFLLNNLHLLEVQDIFRYWPTALIAWGIAKMVDAEETGGRLGAAVLIGTGAIFLADTLGYLDVRMADLWWPVLLIAFGLLLLAEKGTGLHLGIDVSKVKGSGFTKESAVFSGGKRVIVDPNFQGAKYDAVFGGYELDLRRADIAGDTAVLELNAVFGGIEAKVPESWSVIMKGAGVFGGFVDSTNQPDPRLYPSPKRLIVKGGAVFGGVEVKN
ncbi:MAG TPA: DUF5668 domain-containing protein [Bryobacteraceae bacterium]|nr:DUF5668 domain-containing protein [Bryobacteraceae bacterium]